MRCSGLGRVDVRPERRTTRLGGGGGVLTTLSASMARIACYDASFATAHVQSSGQHGAANGLAFRAGQRGRTRSTQAVVASFVVTQAACSRHGRSAVH